MIVGKVAKEFGAAVLHGEITTLPAIQPDTCAGDESRFWRQLLIRVGIDAVDRPQISVINVEHLQGMEERQAPGDIELRLDAQIDCVTVGRQFPLRAVDALLQHAEERNRQLACLEAGGVTCEGTGKDVQVTEIVMGDLVSEDECNRIVMRAALKKAARKVDVPARSGECVERIEPWDDPDEPLFGGAICLKPFGNGTHAIGHEAVLLDVRIGGDFLVQPGAEGLALRDLEIAAQF